MKFWVDNNLASIQGRSILHFAPEAAVARFIKKIAGNYTSADLNANHADVVLNIEGIALPDESVDIVLVSHVLEHVNDAKALRELFRILQPTELRSSWFLSSRVGTEATKTRR